MTNIDLTTLKSSVKQINFGSGAKLKGIGSQEQLIDAPRVIRDSDPNQKADSHIYSSIFLRSAALDTTGSLHRNALSSLVSILTWDF